MLDECGENEDYVKAAGSKDDISQLSHCLWR
jgi:hypothetical protein